MEPALDPESAVSVGRIVGAHGIKGEVKVEPLSDFPERFEAGSRLWLRGQEIRVLRGRGQGRIIILALEGIADRETAEALRDEELYVPAPAPLPEEGVFYRHDLIGLDVVEDGGEKLGKLTDIFSTAANDVYVVRGVRGELLLPAIEDVVKRIDLAAGQIVVELLPGLEFVASASKRPPRPGPAKRRLPSQKTSVEGEL